MLGPANLIALVLDVQRPGLQTFALALPGDGGVQPHPRRKGAVIQGQLILFVQHFDESRLVGRAGMSEGGHHAVTHLPIEGVCREVFPAKLPVLWLVLNAFDY